MSIIFAAFLSALVGVSDVLANVELVYFRAESDVDMITLEWETASELDNLGFNILRAESSNIAQAQAINSSMIPSQVSGQPTGAYYQWHDDNVEVNHDYYYWLQDVDFNGEIENHGPVEASLAGGSLIPTTAPTDTPDPTSAPTDTSQPTATSTPVPTQSSAPTIAATNTPVPTRTPQPTSAAEQPSAVHPTPGSQEVPATAALGDPAATERSVDDHSPTAPTLAEADIGTVVPQGESLSAASAPETKDSSEAAQAVGPNPVLIEQLADKSESDSRAQILGGSEENLEGQDADPEERGISVNRTHGLALIALAAAVLLAAAAGIALWLVLQPKASGSDNE